MVLDSMQMQSSVTYQNLFLSKWNRCYSKVGFSSGDYVNNNVDGWVPPNKPEVWDFSKLKITTGEWDYVNNKWLVTELTLKNNQMMVSLLEEFKVNGEWSFPDSLMMINPPKYLGIMYSNELNLAVYGEFLAQVVGVNSTYAPLPDISDSELDPVDIPTLKVFNNKFFGIEQETIFLFEWFDEWVVDALIMPFGRCVCYVWSLDDYKLGILWVVMSFFIFLYKNMVGIKSLYFKLYFYKFSMFSVFNFLVLKKNIIFWSGICFNKFVLLYDKLSLYMKKKMVLFNKTMQKAKEYINSWK